MSATTKKSLCLALLGPTASGKTEFAMQLAERLNGEILCLDSTTVYRGFDIGSAKPTASTQKKVPHHLVDILDPQEDFSAGQFVERAHAAIDDILSRGKLPLVVGGTYFYLRALQHGMYPVPAISDEVVNEVEKSYVQTTSEREEELDLARMHSDLAAADPGAAKNIHPNDKYRLLRALAVIKATGKKPSEMEPQHKSPHHAHRVWMKYSMAISRHALTANITLRTDVMIRDGLVKETAGLMEKFPAARALQSIGYAEAVAHVKKAITEKQLRNDIIDKTRQLAKRQITWIRSDAEIRFVDLRDGDRVAKEVDNMNFVLGAQ